MYLILYIYSLFSLIIPLKISNSSLTYRSNSYQYGKKNNHIASSKRYYSTDFSKKDSNNLTIEELKLFHHTIIKDLYKDRNAKVIPFKDKVLATCEDINNKSEFLKEWGSSSCIYLIEYKYDPLIYYIGRTSLFKRRFYNHLQANSNNKFHLFLKLVGWEHFKVSIIEIKPVTELGIRENYYIQKYLPILNTTYSSTSVETYIYENLMTKLSNIKIYNNETENGKAKEVYVYTILKDHIDNNFTKYKSIVETNKNQNIARGTISLYIDTNVPFRGKLYYSKPITNIEEIFN